MNVCLKNPIDFVEDDNSNDHNSEEKKNVINTTTSKKTATATSIAAAGAAASSSQEITKLRGGTTKKKQCKKIKSKTKEENLDNLHEPTLQIIKQYLLDMPYNYHIKNNNQIKAQQQQQHNSASTNQQQQQLCSYNSNNNNEDENNNLYLDEDFIGSRILHIDKLIKEQGFKESHYYDHHHHDDIDSEEEEDFKIAQRIAYKQEEDYVLVQEFYRKTISNCNQLLSSSSSSSKSTTTPMTEEEAVQQQLPQQQQKEQEQESSLTTTPTTMHKRTLNWLRKALGIRKRTDLWETTGGHYLVTKSDCRPHHDHKDDDDDDDNQRTATTATELKTDQTSNNDNSKNGSSNVASETLSLRGENKTETDTKKADYVALESDNKNNSSNNNNENNNFNSKNISSNNNNNNNKRDTIPTTSASTNPRRLTRGMARDTRIKRREERVSRENQGLDALLYAVRELEQTHVLPVQKPMMKNNAKHEQKTKRKIVAATTTTTSTTNNDKHSSKNNKNNNNKRQCRQQPSLSSSSPQKHHLIAILPAVSKKASSSSSLTKQNNKKATFPRATKRTVKVTGIVVNKIDMLDFHDISNTTEEQADADEGGDGSSFDIPLLEFTQQQQGHSNQRQHSDKDYAQWCSRLINCLDGNGSAIARHEFFYSDIDRAWFKDSNDFQTDLGNIGVSPTMKLTKAQRSVIRRRLSKRPKRFSKRFISSQIEDLNQHRSSVRSIAASVTGGQSIIMKNKDNANNNIMSSDHDTVGSGVQLPIQGGEKVTAYNKRVELLQNGVVLAYDPSSSRYLIQFEQRQLGCEFCPDTDVARHRPLSDCAYSSR